MIVVSDTSPICYLLLIGEVELLAQLYGKVLIPQIVQQELADERSPAVVKNWINNPPQWLEVQNIDVPESMDLEGLDAGEKAAIFLAESTGAILIIIDDALGRKIARSRGLKITGVLGVLDRAAEQKLVDFNQAIIALEKTTFRASAKLIETLLNQYKYSKKGKNVKVSLRRCS